MATIRGIAKLAGVAPSTVSVALNGGGRIATTTRTRILRIARSKDYRPNQIARSLRSRHTRTIGLLVPSIANPFYPAVARGAEDAAFASGYEVLLCNSDRDEAKEQRYVAALRDKWVDAMIFAAPMVHSSVLRDLASDGVRVVSMNRAVGHDGACEIWIDYKSAAKLAVEHLVSLGHTHIGFIGSSLQLRRFRDRFEGYKEVLTQHGCFRQDLVTIGGYDEEAGYALGAMLLSAKSRPTALFCANDVMAIGAMGAIVDEGLCIPEDLSIVGFDDIPFASVMRPKLTTVHQPSYEVGRIAVELALGIAQHVHRRGRRYVLPTQLVVRDSSGPVRVQK